MKVQKVPFFFLVCKENYIIFSCIQSGVGPQKPCPSPGTRPPRTIHFDAKTKTRLAHSFAAKWISNSRFPERCRLRSSLAARVSNAGERCAGLVPSRAKMYRHFRTRHSNLVRRPLPLSPYVYGYTHPHPTPRSHHIRGPPLRCPKNTTAGHICVRFLTTSKKQRHAKFQHRFIIQSSPSTSRSPPCHTRLPHAVLLATLVFLLRKGKYPFNHEMIALSSVASFSFFSYPQMPSRQAAGQNFFREAHVIIF